VAESILFFVVAMPTKTHHTPIGNLCVDLNTGLTRFWRQNFSAFSFWNHAIGPQTINCSESIEGDFTEDLHPCPLKRGKIIP